MPANACREARASLDPDGGVQPDRELPAVSANEVNEQSLPARRMIGFHDFSYPDTQFRICLFSGPSLPQAESLVKRAYARLGYTEPGDAFPQERLCAASTASLHAVDRNTTLGTLCVNLEGHGALHAEALYPDEVCALRRLGRLCEFTRLAVDTALAGREVLCSLFYVAYLYAHAIHQAKHLVIEVNPRHRHFYQRMLGFELVGTERMCPRVAAPAVLLHLDFDHTREQIERARRGLSVAGTTLYRYAAPSAEEQTIIRKLGATL